MEDAIAPEPPASRPGYNSTMTRLTTNTGPITKLHQPVRVRERKTLGTNSNQNGHDGLVVTVTHLNVRSAHAHRSYNPCSPHLGRSEQCLGNRPRR